MSSHKEQLKQKCGKLVNNSFISDVVFAVGKEGTLIYGHSVPLVHFSEVFRSMIQSDGRNRRKHKSSFIVDDVEPDIFLEMLNFIYCDHCEITQLNVMGILYVADKYKLYELERRCESVLTENDCSGAMLEAFINSHPTCSRMTELCLNQICTNPLRVFRHPLFMNLPACLFKKIVELKSIRCSDYQLVDVIERWGAHQPECVRDEINGIEQIIKDRIDNVSFNREYGGKQISMLKSDVSVPRFNGQLKAYRDLYLYGVGVYAGISQHCSEGNVIIQISVGGDHVVKEKIEIEPSDDDHSSVQDCFFKRIRLSEGQKVDIDVSMPTDLHFRQFVWYSCTREGMRCMKSDDFELQNSDSKNQLSPIAYLLYDTID
ncbi:BTB/POZ domain-containing protein 3-like [Toxorhynchites rutilus septentrionalis]|uniref:BTB/POZ domain-containing protein 3-like n=1 Tax=Toxorhynchites rutilus septentrionalis TaxID=329112 RepID=UPI002478FD2E|nr:BTB/POZ domain-containing protein 3-like [Toxorhynchites rutilus septentrionalis]